MKAAAVLVLAAGANASIFSGQGPRFTIDVSDPSLSDGVGSLNLEGEYAAELVENVNAGIRYEYNVSRDRPSSVWISTSCDLDESSLLAARAEYDIVSKATLVEARVSRGDDSVSIDFDTGSNTAGPLKVRKSIDLNGRRLTLKPNFNLQDRTGELVINTEVDADRTTAELSLNQATESASLEVSHRLDDYNIVSPKVDLKSGDISVRLNRALEDGGVLEVTADRNNVDWEIREDQWTVRGNIPLKDTGASAISFKRSISL